MIKDVSHCERAAFFYGLKVSGQGKGRWLTGCCSLPPRTTSGRHGALWLSPVAVSHGDPTTTRRHLTITQPLSITRYTCDHATVIRFGPRKVCHNRKKKDADDTNINVLVTKFNTAMTDTDSKFLAKTATKKKTRVANELPNVTKNGN